jgi:5-methyltetrahydropteroyltriglutamate--homocysteine methyltransferase
MATAAPHDPPFRADHVGSLLRPPELLQARDAHTAGNLAAGALRDLEDRSIRNAVALQEEVGLQSITDGEYRREVFYTDFYCRGLGGVNVAYDPTALDEMFFIDRDGHKLPIIVARVHARMRWTAPIHVADFNFLRALTSRTPKLTIPRPRSSISAPAAPISAATPIPTSTSSGKISSTLSAKSYARSRTPDAATSRSTKPPWPR